VLLDRWRRWDRTAAQRVDRYVANSQVTAARIRRYLGRDAAVLHPPVETSRFRPGARPVGDHYVVLGELMAHKRVDVAIRAFNALRRPLVVVGDGPELRRLRRMAGPTVRFTGRVSDERVEQLLAGAQALVVCATEEFGIGAVEALAAGRPVIALAEGGVLESVTNGVTGALYERNEPAALAQTVAAFDPAAIDPRACRAAAERFDAECFRVGLRSIVDGAVAAATAPHGRFQGDAIRRKNASDFLKIH
jgi:glycosyltransferase involved in cell wall biosynthesis